MAHVRIVRDIYLSSFWVELHFSYVFFLLLYRYNITVKQYSSSYVCLWQSWSLCLNIYKCHIHTVRCCKQVKYFFCKNAHMCYLGYMCGCDATYMNNCLFVYLYFGFDMYEWWQQRAGGRSLYLTTYKTENKNKINMHKETKLYMNNDICLQRVYMQTNKYVI